MNPIVLILPGNHGTVVVTPKRVGNNYTEATWRKFKITLEDALTAEILDKGSTGGAEQIVQLIQDHSREWMCNAEVGISICTWCLVE